MSDDRIPYPDGPDPDDVPDDLVAFPASYRSQQWILLISLFIFLFVYLFLLGASGFLTLWMLVTIKSLPVLKILGVVFFTGCFAFLLTGFFARTEDDPELLVRVTEDDQPVLFGFIRRVCEETGAEEPERIYVRPDVNAAVVTRISVVNLVTPAKKELHIGLALINCLNLSEFQSVLAHEFGHFTQGSFLASYTNQVLRVILGMAGGRTWVDSLADGLKRAGDAGAIVGSVLAGLLTAFRWVLMRFLNLIGYHRFALAREQEFHADLVSASVAGSNAAVHALYRTKFGDEALSAAVDDLRRAADHELYSADLYYHQHAAADFLRMKRRDPHLGIPPTYDHPIDGRVVQIFPPDDDDPADHGDYHPSPHDREENVKTRFVPAPIDGRSPWVLFTDAAALRETMTYKFYRRAFKVRRDVELAEPRHVQAFIDEEKQEITHDHRYEGVYDDRLIDPGDLDVLNGQIRDEPWEDDRLAEVHRRLYLDVAGRVDERRELVNEYEKVRETSKDRPGKKTRKLLRDLQNDLDAADEWFHALDRRAYLVHVQMAYRVQESLYFDLINRYRFHMAVQGIFRSARHHADQAYIHFTVLAGLKEVTSDLFAEVRGVLRDARANLRRVLREAKAINMPAMKHFAEGERLADYLLDQELVRELPESVIRGRWVGKLMDQLETVKTRAARLHGKSLGGILKLQEQIAEAYFAPKNAPAPEIVDVEVYEPPTGTV
jgi:Zn-dependent protease with chaperone function